MNIKHIIRLAEVMNQHGLTEVEIKEADSSIRLSRAVTTVAAPVPAAGGFTAAVTIDSGEKNDDSATALTEQGEEAAGTYITAPMPGTFFTAAAPGDAPFVNVGSEVTPRSIVCIVEAMKVMNEVRAECSGTIAKILVENGAPVEYGQRLFEIR